jgi:mycothiol S-conjugate amidase
LRGSKKLCRAFGSLLLLGSMLLTNVVTHRADAKSPHDPDFSADKQGALNTPLPAPPKRLLVIVPHPDDASLGGTAMIDRTLKSGGRVQLAVLTSGDGFRLAATRTFGVAHPGPRDLFRLGLVRQQEELASARQLGLRPQDVVFFGYPDSGLHQLWSSSHWLSNMTYQAPNGFDHVPYPLAYHQGAPYCGQSVVDDMRVLIDRFQPTDVLFPDPHDIHNDHWATSAFTQYVLDAMPRPPHAWTYLIHYPNFPVPRYYRPRLTLTPPQDVMKIGGLDWLTLPLDDTLQASKKRAILSHKSQVSVMGDLLLSFVRSNDLIGHYLPPTIRDQVEEEHDPFATAERQLPYTVVVDPAWDDSKERHVTSADIRQVAMVHSGNRLHICVEYAGDVRPDLEYWLRLRLPDLPLPRQQQVEFHIQGGKLSNHPLTVSFANSEIPTVTTQPRRLILSLPDTPFQQANRILFSTDVSQNQQTLDKTAWHTLLMHTIPSP